MTKQLSTKQMRKRWNKEWREIYFRREKLRANWWQLRLDKAKKLYLPGTNGLVVYTNLYRRGKIFCAWVKRLKIKFPRNQMFNEFHVKHLWVK